MAKTETNVLLDKFLLDEDVEYVELNDKDRKVLVRDIVKSWKEGNEILRITYAKPPSFKKKLKDAYNFVKHFKRPDCKNQKYKALPPCFRVAISELLVVTRQTYAAAAEQELREGLWSDRAMKEDIKACNAFDAIVFDEMDKLSRGAKTAARTGARNLCKKIILTYGFSPIKKNDIYMRMYFTEEEAYYILSGQDRDIDLVVSY